jgi:type IV secretion system protein VirB10
MQREKRLRLFGMSKAIAAEDGLPLVGEDSGNQSLWLGLGAIFLSGFGLFLLLQPNLQTQAAPQIAPPKDYAIASTPQPELAVPNIDSDRPIASAKSLARTLPAPDAPKLPPVQLTRTRPPSDAAPGISIPAPAYLPAPIVQPTVPDPGRAAPVVVYEAVQTPSATNNGTPLAAGVQASKAFAIGSGDRTYIVSQGTLISAVLETAIDSTQAGQVRAMISTNVYNASGSQVLIPKGSRIFGEYKGELGTGQNRAQILWTRLIRPDGATIALDSPASDSLGRAGIKGRVNTHFGERLLGALLQSTIDFGVLAASRAVSSNNGVIVTLPSAAQGAGSQIIQPPPKPTLKVRHGTSIAVFVARDLDFSTVK